MTIGWTHWRGDVTIPTVTKSWKVTVNKNAIHFLTSEEAAYPFVLCQRIVECVKQKVFQMGVGFHNACRKDPTT